MTESVSSISSLQQVPIRTISSSSQQQQYESSGNYQQQPSSQVSPPQSSPQQQDQLQQYYSQLTPGMLFNLFIIVLSLIDVTR